MGRRHLKGLLRAGFRVTAFDPRRESFDIARHEMEQAGLPVDSLQWVTQIPAERFGVAVFAETAAYRYRNLGSFLKVSSAGRILLEKPLSADPREVNAFTGLVRSGESANVNVNFPRRTWPFVKQLKSLCDASSHVRLTVNGGAFGFGCNGIHYLDLFIYLVGGDQPDVQFARISPLSIASGRGSEFRDIGGQFVVANQRGMMFCSGEASSSAGSLFTICGDHFLAGVDETDLSWRLMERDPASSAPNYRCGRDYHTSSQGALQVDALDVVTERWATGQLSLPDLDEALRAHGMLHAILTAGGIAPPYQYT